MKPVTCNYAANNPTNTTPSIFLPSKHQQLFKKILNVISQLHWESFGVQSDGFVLKESSCAIQARNNFLSSDLVSLQQKGAERKKKKRHGKKPQTPGFAGKGEGLGADPLRRRFLSCSIARGLKEPREKKTPGWKASPANTKQRRRSPWTQRGKQINKQEITFSSLPPPPSPTSAAQTPGIHVPALSN